jgi:hypothetical protein
VADQVEVYTLEEIREFARSRTWTQREIEVQVARFQRAVSTATLLKFIQSGQAQLPPGAFA